MVKMLSVNIRKGGTGKTSVVYNLGEDAAIRHNKRVLLIDEDESENLSKRYRNYDVGLIKDENKIINLYKGKPVVPIHIHKNLDILVSSPELETIEEEIKDKHNSRLILFSWIANNYDELNEKYDYIIIDTHNDEKIITQNALAASDVVIGVSDPSFDGFEALIRLGKLIENLKSSLIEIRSKESYVIADYYIIGNKIKHNTNSSREFREIIEQEQNYLGFILDKELVHSGNLEAKPLVEMANDPKTYREHKNFFDATFEIFDRIYALLDEKEGE